MAEDYNSGELVRELVIGDLQTGATRRVDAAQSFRWFGFLPSGDRVLLSAYTGEDDCGASRFSVRVAGLTDPTRSVWEGTSSPHNVVFGADGNLLGFDGWGDTGSIMVVIDLASGRSVELPRPERTWMGSLLAIHGGTGLPDPAVPTALDEPSGSVPAPALIADAPHIVSTSVAYDPLACTATASVRLLAPSVDGGLAVVDEMPPFVFADVGRHDAFVSVTPRPGTSTVLVSYHGRRTSESFLWTPEPGRPPGSDPVIEPLLLPSDWPDDRIAGEWRPDGGALAFGSTRARNFLWFDRDELVTHRIRVGVDESWSEVIGWTPDGSSILIERRGCIDCSDIVKTWVGVLRLSDGRVRDVTPDAPIRAIGTGTENVSVRTGLEAEGSAGTNHIQFSVGIGVPGDFTLRLPRRLGNLDGVTDVWSRDGRSLYVVTNSPKGAVLLRIDDPKPDTQLRPTVVGHLPEGAAVEEVEIASTWAHIQISELGSCSEGLVNLDTGEAYLEQACFWSAAWLPGT